MNSRFVFCIVPAFALACCVSPPAPPPAPPPPRPAPAPAPPPAPVGANWQDRPVASGDWVYRADPRGSIAFFGTAGQQALMTLRCDTASRRVFVSVPGSSGGPLTLQATTGAKTYAALPVDATPPYVAAEIAASDPQLDAIAFSRGRFLVGFAGAPDLIVPTWPEVTRIIEDCRG